MVRQRNETRFDHRYFEAIDTEPKAYWLGFLMADGCVYDNPAHGAMQLSVHLAAKDAGHLFRFREAICANKKIYSGGSNGSVRFCVSSDRMCSDLIRLGCTPRKSLVLRYPTIAPPLERHLVRGYFDGDGSACISSGTLFIQFVGTEDFLGGVARVLEFSRSSVCRGNYFNLAVNSRDDVSRAFDLFYRDATVFLERKRAVFESGLHRPPVVVVCQCCGTAVAFEIGRGKANRRYCSLRCRQKSERNRKKGA